MTSDAALYRLGNETLLASWEAYAQGSPDAGVRRLPGVTAAVFPSEPERSVYNNALLDRPDAVAAMEVAYAEAGVTRFAAWVHESDEATRSALEERDYRLDQTTRAMGMSLEDVRLPRPQLELGSVEWDEYLRIFGLPPSLLGRADRTPFRVLVAHLDGEKVATAMAFDHGSDTGIFNVATLEHARRRGLGTALTALHVHDALARSLRTATLQATEMAEGMYAAVGFRDLGRILEFVPSRGRGLRNGGPARASR
jgi:ribosomal protein S18 acetylase RimI-like enzyme